MTVYGDTGEMLEWAESKILSLIGGRGGEEEEEIEYEEQAAELRFSDEDMSEFLRVQYCLSSISNPTLLLFTCTCMYTHFIFVSVFLCLFASPFLFPSLCLLSSP